MAKVRPAGAKDREALRKLTAQAFGLSAAEGLEPKPPPGSRVWLAWPGEEGEPAGYCRMVPDRETRARGRACLDGLFVARGRRRKGLARALIGAAREAALQDGLEGLWAYLPVDLPGEFLAGTGGRKIQGLRLLRHERLDEIPSPSLPAGHRIRPPALPGDMAPLAALYNEAFGGMWNFRPHGPGDIAAWFEATDTRPENCLLLEREGPPAEGVGMALLAIDPGRLAAGDRAAYIPDIGVLPAHRRRGMGRALLCAAAAHARARGLQALELIADEADEEARRFYRGAGFEERGTICVYEW